MQLWQAADTLSPRVRQLRDEYWSFYERECTNEVRAYTTGTPWDIVYSIWSWTNVPEVALFQPAFAVTFRRHPRPWNCHKDFGTNR